MSNLVYIGEEEVSKLLTWDRVYVAVEEALLCSVSEERAFQSARSFTKMLGKGDSLFLTMPGCLKSDKFGTVAGCKLVTKCSGNAQRLPPLPTIMANITLFNEDTGALEAVVAGTEITAQRTAAASLVATKHLTRGKDVKVLAILGAGAQGRIHALAFCHFYDLDEVRIWNHNHGKSETLASELNGSSPRNLFKSVRSNEECVRGADVIVTATFSSSAIVQKGWLKDGAHINAVGAGINHHKELSEAIYKSSDVYIDHVEGAKSELAGLGEIGVQFKGAIGDVIEGSLKPTTDPNKITVFQSLGMAVEDCAVAKMIYNLHQQK